MPDYDDVPVPRAIAPVHGAPYWLEVARANLGPRRAKPTIERPSLRHGLSEMADYETLNPVYGPPEPEEPE